MPAWKLQLVTLEGRDVPAANMMRINAVTYVPGDPTVVSPPVVTSPPPATSPVTIVLPPSAPYVPPGSPPNHTT